MRISLSGTTSTEVSASGASASCAGSTSSPHAKSLLADWPKTLAAFRRVTPVGSTAILGAPAVVAKA